MKKKLLKKMEDENIDKRLIQVVKDAMKNEINIPKGRKKFLKGKKIMFACCFCPYGIKENDKNMIRIKIESTKQLYFSHFKCLKKRMTERCRNELVKI